MSLWELLVVACVILVVAKPEDLPVIVKYVKEFRKHLSEIRKNIFAYLDDNTEKPEDPEQINFYVQKIVSIEGKYEGEYKLDALKARYKELVSDRISKGSQGQALK